MARHSISKPFFTSLKTPISTMSIDKISSIKVEIAPNKDESEAEYCF